MSVVELPYVARVSPTRPPNAYGRADQWPEGPFTRLENDAALLAAVKMAASIAVEVRTARTRRYWSQDDLAKHAGVSKYTISRLESGGTWSDLRVVLRVCAALDLQLSVAPST